MSRIGVFCLLAFALLSNETQSFVISSINIRHRQSSSSALSYASSAASTVEAETYKVTASSKSLSDLVTQQIARQFSAAQRYAVAAMVLKAGPQLYFAEEDQRMQAVQLIEVARHHNIELGDYQALMEDPPQKSQGLEAFSHELLQRGVQDTQALEQLSMAAPTNEKFMATLESIKSAQAHWDQELVLLVERTIPSMDLSKMDAAAEPVTDKLYDVAEYAPLDGHLNFQQVHEGIPLDQATNDSFLSQLKMDLSRWLEDVPNRVGDAALHHYFGAAVDTNEAITEALPSPGDLVEALPVAVEEVAYVVDAIQQTFI